MPEDNILGGAVLVGLALGLLVWVGMWGAAAGFALFVVVACLEDIRVTIARK